jgi:hypothetical protein
VKFPYNQVLQIKRRYQDGELPREEAKEQLAFVLELGDDDDMCVEASSKHAISYGPLVRLSDVCSVLTLWAEQSSTELPTDSHVTKETRQSFREAWNRVRLAIDKSNFLSRLFFTDEGLRTEPCEYHKGRWGGCWPVWNETPCACQAGGNVTGWLPADQKFADLTYWDDTKKQYRPIEETV